MGRASWGPLMQPLRHTCCLSKLPAVPVTPQADAACWMNIVHTPRQRGNLDACSCMLLSGRLQQQYLGDEEVQELCAAPAHACGRLIRSQQQAGLRSLGTRQAPSRQKHALYTVQTQLWMLTAYRHQMPVAAKLHHAAIIGSRQPSGSELYRGRSPLSVP